MPQQRVTLTLPAELVREARAIAVDRGVSLSKYVAMLVEEQVAARRPYEEARERHRALLERGLDLGTQGRIAWSRDSLHER
jgi:hypothetical protein